MTTPGLADEHRDRQRALSCPGRRVWKGRLGSPGPLQVSPTLPGNPAFNQRTAAAPCGVSAGDGKAWRFGFLPRKQVPACPSGHLSVPVYRPGAAARWAPGRGQGQRHPPATAPGTFTWASSVAGVWQPRRLYRPAWEGEY